MWFEGPTYDSKRGKSLSPFSGVRWLFRGGVVLKKGGFDCYSKKGGVLPDKKGQGFARTFLTTGKKGGWLARARRAYARFARPPPWLRQGSTWPAGRVHASLSEAGRCAPMGAPHRFGRELHAFLARALCAGDAGPEYITSKASAFFILSQLLCSWLCKLPSFPS